MKDFIWTDDLVSEFAYQFLEQDNNLKIGQSRIEQFKKSKQATKDYEILEWYYHNEPYDGSLIKSIKRISDGEVFSVGDRIDGYRNSGIKEIRLTNIGLRIITDARGDGCSADELSWRLEDCVKSKSLFTTEQQNEIISIVKKAIKDAI